MASVGARGVTAAIGAGLLLAAYFLGNGAVSGLLFQLNERPAAETTSGTMQSVRYYEVERGDDRDSFVVELVYTYRVGGASHTGTELYPDGSSSFDSERAAQDFVKSHRPGATVTVHYLPGEPRESWLAYEHSRFVGAAGSALVVAALAAAALLGAAFLGSALYPPAFEDTPLHPDALLG